MGPSDSATQTGLHGAGPHRRGLEVHQRSSTGVGGVLLTRRNIPRGVRGVGALAAVGAGWGTGRREAGEDAALAVGWMGLLYDLVRREGLSPSAAARVYAYTSVALDEAVASGDTEYRSLARQLNAMRRMPSAHPVGPADVPSAVIAAVATVAARLFRAAASVEIEQRREDQLRQRSPSGVPAAALDRSADHT
jgi:hypothetical protein